MIIFAEYITFITNFITMKKVIKSFFAVVIALGAAACSSPEKMAEMAENVIVECNPAVLEVVAGKI